MEVTERIAHLWSLRNHMRELEKIASATNTDVFSHAIEETSKEIATIEAEVKQNTFYRT